MARLGLLLLFALVGLAGCSSTGGGGGSDNPNAGRYSMTHDRYPDAPADVSNVPDAVPRIEPQSRGGNKSPYEVLGKKYHIMPSAAGYSRQGTASWYGEKFHGHLTSNGEVYDMYKMSAAHKSLPLPSYVRVTNLSNRRQVIVRVNDRGPFHDNRLIDLSYAAAAKLGMLNHGTARVEVEAIDPVAWNSKNILPESENMTAKPAGAQLAATKAATEKVATQKTAALPTPVSAEGRYLQVGAFSTDAAARKVQDKLVAAAAGSQVQVRSVERDGRSLYRVLIGPLSSDVIPGDLISRVQAAGHSSPILVDYP
ncbi:septal ring lytic transglycosylase RlpA family protein [Marinobacterium lutimaris]|uniref:Endolytic peptidoglycan transglycosylase RlpA n=1 Tax=Marinobacterium lutimaris TaxID=568106 RepID=A0A1H6CVL2_9GAMM|nr:septal ring lytic transglycosylase RlpA family protein [Marinobacterium lutimaris]SEG76565.1 rare lipoprotein A [Marinobacterium lutimaris]